MEPRSLASLEGVSEKINEVTANFRELMSGVLSQVASEKFNGKFTLGSGVNQLRELGWETGTIEQQVRSRFQQFGRRMSNVQLPPVINNAVESSKNYAAENPMTAVVIVALALSCAIPVCVFLSFAFVTLLVTFAGFLFVEGTILGIASVVLGGALLIVGCITLGFVSVGLLAYFVATRTYTLITGDKNPHRYLAQLPLIGHLFVNLDHSDSNGEAAKIINGYSEEEEQQQGDDNLASD